MAGLAAAVELTERGWPVTLLEQRSFCGGRAYSFREPVTGDVIDNGQHVMMGCYRATFRYLSQIGAADGVTIEPRLTVWFAAADGVLHALDCPAWSAPWHLVAGLARLRGFGLGNLWRLRKGLRQLREYDTAAYAMLDQWSVAEWLAQLGQDARASAALWTPLTLAVMNEIPERASAAAFTRMLHEGTLHQDVPLGLAVPRRSLSALLVDPAVATIQARGAEVRCSTVVEQLVLDGTRVRSVRCRNGATLEGDVIISTLPPRELQRLLAASGVSGDPYLAPLQGWESVPICSVHLWYDRPVLPQPMVGLLEAPFHWAFDTARLRATTDYSGPRGHWCVALVSSACRDLVAASRTEVVAAADAVMQRHFPLAREAKVQHVQMTKELHATVAVTKGSAARRLPTVTPWSNLFLAGDWTQTELPATIEGAIRSGVAAAAAAMQPAQPVDLPTPMNLVYSRG